jgi:hypothetical protein
MKSHIVALSLFLTLTACGQSDEEKEYAALTKRLADLKGQQHDIRARLDYLASVENDLSAYNSEAGYIPSETLLSYDDEKCTVMFRDINWTNCMSRLNQRLGEQKLGTLREQIATATEAVDIAKRLLELEQFVHKLN